LDAELAAIRPWMACGGVPPEQRRSEGTPSPSEGPMEGQAFLLTFCWAGTPAFEKSESL
jgi:hypothetical protein